METEAQNRDSITEAIAKAVVERVMPEKNKESKQLPVSENLQKLNDSYKVYEKKYEFKKGDLVEWKPLLKNRSFPEYNYPAIVIEVLPKPIIDHEQDAGSPQFKEPLSIKLGVYVNDDRFLIYYFDKNRFQPYKTK